MSQQTQIHEVTDSHRDDDWSAPLRSGRSMNDWELWVFAAKFLRAYGDTAALQASAMARNSDGEGDAQSALQWRAICERICELQDRGIRWLS
jgi:hypothetical protein